MGNCGVGAAPTRKEGREFMMNILGVVEDIPVEVMREGVQWEVNGKEWETFPEWLDALDQIPYAVDIAAMVAHSAVRPFVLGLDRCNISDKKGGPNENPLTNEEKQAVADCVKEAIAAGAVGFSTSRFTGHRDSTGQLAPGSLADADEIIMIAKGMAEAGGAMLEMINDFSSYDDIPMMNLDEKLRKEHFEREQDWIRYVAKEYGIPVNWTDVPTAPGGKGGDNSFMEGEGKRWLSLCVSCGAEIWLTDWCFLRRLPGRGFGGGAADDHPAPVAHLLLPRPRAPLHLDAYVQADPRDASRDVGGAAEPALRPLADPGGGGGAHVRGQPGRAHRAPELGPGQRSMEAALPDHRGL